MIVACPNCQKRYKLNPALVPADQTLRCHNCGHSWIETGLLQLAAPIEDLPINSSVPMVINGDKNLPAIVDHEEIELLQEVKELAEESRKAAEKLKERRRQQRQRAIKWGALAAAISVPLAIAAIIPDVIARYAPGTAMIYRAAGIELHPAGFKVDRVENQKLIVDDVPVLAIKGQVRNVSLFNKRAPALHFTLKDASGKTLHEWTLGGVKAQSMEPGEISPFVTRLASPPEGAEQIEIRFAS